MKTSTRTTIKKTPIKTSVKVLGKVPVKKATATRSKRSSLSRAVRTTKRVGKQTLRDLLLSKTFNTGFKILLGLMISGSALYGAYAFIGNTFANDVVVSKAEILIRVAKHTTLPTETPEAVVRVQDAEVLKKQNEFYANVKEGDYIIMYPKLAVIYDLRNDSIVALKRTER